MTTTFSGILHDRSASTSTSVTVQTQPGSLRIQRPTGPALSWQAHDIQSARKTSEGWAVLQCGQLYLEVEQPEFAAQVQQAFPEKRLFKGGLLTDKIGVAGCLIIGLLLLGLAVSVFLVGIPLLAERAVERVPPEVEEQIGSAWYEAMAKQYQTDTSASRRVQHFFETLGYPVHYPIRVSVVQGPTVNAFALPGGRIVVFDGLLKTIDRPEQLAALLGHEASHVDLRHSTRAVFREMSNGLFFSLLFGDFNTISQVVGQQSQYLSQLSYSRRLEVEADAQAIQWMRQSKLPISGMRDLFRKMKNAAPATDQADVPNFLSTHPSLDDRIQRIEAVLGGETITPDSIPTPVQRAWQELPNR